MNGVCHIWGLKNDYFFWDFPIHWNVSSISEQTKIIFPVICVFSKCAMDSGSFDLWVDSESEMGK